MAIGAYRDAALIALEDEAVAGEAWKSNDDTHWGFGSAGGFQSSGPP